VAVLDALSDADAICHISQSLRTVDPRPDLVADSTAWTELLVIATTVLGEADALLGTLLGLLTAGEMEADEYAADRKQWLMPRRREVGELLRRIQIGDV